MCLCGLQLHQFPGYDPAELTPLPGHDATEILQIVVDASVDLDKKVSTVLFLLLPFMSDAHKQIC